MKMKRSEAIEELDQCLDANRFPAWEAIAIAHKNLKQVEEVVVRMTNLKDELEAIPSMRRHPAQNGKIEIIKYYLTMLTEKEEEANEKG